MKAGRLYRKVLAVFLTVIMLTVALMPFVSAESEQKKESPKKAVFSIDAGRKYFSKGELERLIQKAGDLGYTDFQLILGNDGLRFFLDDMTVETGYGKYSSGQVKNAISEGNSKYYDDPEGNYLTESEMNEIMAYAMKKGIKIIPLINSPGHMDAILYGMEKLGIEKPAYPGSVRTVDLSNKAAVDFTRTLINKYMTYFSGKSEIFNLGCDEYANDLDNGGWSKLQDTGKYKDFVKYVNALSGDVKDHGMEPMCFNDGIYYGKQDRFGKFDKEIIISYWNAGWLGYNPAPASYLSEKGHRILNTNHKWYWVIGNFRKKEHGNPYTYWKAVLGANFVNFNSVPGGGKVPTIGSMQCVWCDYPENGYDPGLVNELMDLFAKKNSAYMKNGETEKPGIKKIFSGIYEKIKKRIEKIGSTEATIVKYSAGNEVTADTGAVKKRSGTKNPVLWTWVIAGALIIFVIVRNNFKKE